MLNLINFMTYTTQGIIVDYVIVIIVAIALATPRASCALTVLINSSNLSMFF